MMRIFNCAKMLLLSVVAMTLASCGDDVYNTIMQNSNEQLCGKTWMEEYAIDENETCRHQLKFAMDNSGREFFQYYRNGESRPYKENSYYFDWKWTDDTRENMEINYGAGSVVFFNNVWVREHNLSGKFGGKIVMFVDTFTVLATSIP